MMLLYKTIKFFVIATLQCRCRDRGQGHKQGDFSQMDIKQVLSDEIRRLARKEIKQAVAPLHAAISALKKQIAEQKRQIADLEKHAVEANVESVPKAAEDEGAEKTVRINASGILRLRTKLGLTQGEFAKLLGVALHTVSVWEQGRRIPRYKHKVRICALRGLGKRDLKKMLEDADPNPAPVEK